MTAIASTHRRHWLACAGALLLGGPTARAASAWQEALPGARLRGEGTFRWLGLAIYQARLWQAGTAPFDPLAPFALELTYRRSIRRDQFVDTSADEILKLQPALPAGQLAQWRAAMERCFIDVAPGDQLIGVSLGAGGSRFYGGDRALCTVADPAFAAAFFGIWLDPRTREPQLRRQLTGEATAP